MATEGAIAVTPVTDPLTEELTQLRQENELLRAERQQRLSELEIREALRDPLLEQQQEKERTIAQLQHQLQQLLRRHFGRSAEKIDPKQMLLFQTLLDQLAPETNPADATPPADSPTNAPRRNGHGRRRLPKDLPRKTRVHDLPEDEKPCPGCGQMRHVIGREVREQLDYQPAKVHVIEHVRFTYARRHCTAQAAETGSQIVTAEKPATPIEKGLAGPGLLSCVIVSKYADHLPLHRLERILERHGIAISRKTMCGWKAQCAELLTPLYERMVHKVLESKVIHTDEMPVDVLDRDRTETRTGRFWVYLGDQEHPLTVFGYTASRSRDGPMQFLEGWGRARRVYLQADAFGGYDGIYAGEAGGHVTEAACWAHARRKFYDARTSDAAGSTQALAYIRLLYDVEDEAKRQIQQETLDFDSKDQSAAAAARAAAIRLTLRQEKTVPRLTQFKQWLLSQQVEHGGPFGLPSWSPSLPKSPVGQAITYARNQRDALCVYTTDGDLAIDNNASENALRRVAIGRKNGLFCGSDNGGRTAATLFSLIATCQRHKVEPFAYLRNVLSRIADTPVSQPDSLLPDRWTLRAEHAATN